MALYPFCFVKIGVAVQMLWKIYADGAIVLLFFFFFQGRKSATECRKVTRESIGKR